jgi:site-specific recombinase XerD
VTTPRTTPIERQIVSFDRWLNFENKSGKTRTVYTNAARKFASWVAEHHAVRDWADVTRDHIQGFVISILDTRSAGYASNLFRALQQFSKWYSTEHDEDHQNPMAGMKPPMLPEQETPVLRENELKALLKSCEGKEFVQRRDAAIIYLFLDSGIRRTELAALRVEDVDLDHREVTVLGKGRRTRTVAFGRKAAWALDRYITERDKHALAELPELWLGERNKQALTGSGIAQMLERRALKVGLEKLHPHMLRHTWAHMMKQANMSDEEIMKIAGWRSPAMMARYAASTASERARESNKRLAPGDRL